MKQTFSNRYYLLQNLVIACACIQPGFGAVPQFIPTSPVDTGVVQVGYDGFLAADMNGDGKLDLVTVDYQVVSVLLGIGDGTFQSPVVTTGAFYYPWGPSKAVGDLNGDGKLDLVVADEHSLVVLLGNGDGTFQPPAAYFVGGTGAEPLGLALGDFNNDGHLDAVVGHLVDKTYVSVLLGKGDGTFQPERTYATVADPVHLAVADFDGDGHTDFVAGSDVDYGMSFFRGLGNGTFQATPVPTNRPAYTGSLLAKDLNGDGRADLVIGAGSGSTTVWLGQGNGTFTGVPFPSDQVYGDVFAAEDFDRNGTVDLLVSGSTTYSLWLAPGNGDGTFQPPGLVYTNAQFFHAVAGDFNGDGWQDIAVGYTVQDALGQVHGYISILLNAAALRLQVTRANGNLMLSWPANLGKYQLESTDSLDATANWSDEPELPVLSAGRNTVTVPMDDASRFFRLKQL
jgi:hypothetical protein